MLNFTITRKTILKWGWLSVNDIRRLENMPPILNGDIYIQPPNISKSGKVQQEDQLRAMTEKVYEMITNKAKL